MIRRKDMRRYAPGNAWRLIRRKDMRRYAPGVRNTPLNTPLHAPLRARREEHAGG